MPEYEQSDEIIDFDEIPEHQEFASDKPRIDPGAHNLQILGTDFYRNINDNLIAKLWVKSKTQAESDTAKVQRTKEETYSEKKLKTGSKYHKGQKKRTLRRELNESANAEI